MMNVLQRQYFSVELVLGDTILPIGALLIQADNSKEAKNRALHLIRKLDKTFRWNHG